MHIHNCKKKRRDHDIFAASTKPNTAQENITQHNMSLFIRRNA